MLGIGAMLGALGGNEESYNAWQKANNNTITSMKLEPESNGGDGALKITFADGVVISLMDCGRSCCESRYITTDDNPDDFTDAKLLDIESTSAPEENDEYGEPHEQEFVRLKTSKGTFTLCTHNKHNGYYGGFHIVLREGASL